MEAHQTNILWIHDFEHKYLGLKRLFVYLPRYQTKKSQNNFISNLSENCLSLFICFESSNELNTSKQRLKTFDFADTLDINDLLTEFKIFVSTRFFLWSNYFTKSNKWSVDQIDKSFTYYRCNVFRERIFTILSHD